ncbi:MAG: hypothetical protein ACI840_001578 [Ulvibacter sp.]|jgi:uncharacterized protein (DUF2141 family)
MKHRLLYIPILFLFLLSFVDCAKKGTPSGGKKDSIPPVVVKSSPENYSTSFTGNEIKITFDEYIKLKDLQKELIVSPPLKYTPQITPLNASKILKIKILDTLKENTTYSFNFGNSITDNNEGNAYEFFKYVFSTGTFIDSLKLSGKVQDAQFIRPEQPTSLLLYEINELFKDSLVFSEKPTYITTSKDSTSTFEFTNLKEGSYLLLALKEENNDYTFQPTKDKIGFINSNITIPTDSSYTVTLFKEDLPNKIGRPKHITKNQISFGFEGDSEGISLELLSDTPDGFDSRLIKDLKTDSLQYWFKPETTLDSMVFVARNYGQVDTLNVRIKDLYRDTLRFNPINAGILTARDTFKIKANTPIINIDPEKLQIMDKDSVVIAATLSLDTIYNLAKVNFAIEEEQIYKIQLLPGAFTDFYNASNDTLRYAISTKPISDYGTLNMTLVNAPQTSIIVQFVNENYKVLQEKYLTENKSVLFDYIAPGNYFVRIVYDENENGKWDSGNFLERRAPEKIIYYPSKIEVNTNWSLNETFILE